MSYRRRWALLASAYGLVVGMFASIGALVLGVEIGAGVLAPTAVAMLVWG